MEIRRHKFIEMQNDIWQMWQQNMEFRVVHFGIRIMDDWLLWDT